MKDAAASVQLRCDNNGGHQKTTDPASIDETDTRTPELQKMSVEDSWKDPVPLEDEDDADFVPQIDEKMVEKLRLSVKNITYAVSVVAFSILATNSLSFRIFLVANC